jgi:hypothetical protein
MSKKHRQSEVRKNGSGRRGDPHRNKYARFSKAPVVPVDGQTSPRGRPSEYDSEYRDYSVQDRTPSWAKNWW